MHCGKILLDNYLNFECDIRLQAVFMSYVCNFKRNNVDFWNLFMTTPRPPRKWI